MYNFDYYDKAIEFIYETAEADVSAAVELGEYESVFLEDGEASSFIKRMIDGIRKFFSRIAKVITDFFDRKEVTKLKSAELPSKLRVSSKNQKLINEGKVTLKQLQKCKTSDDVERAMTAYRRKKAAIKAGTTMMVITGVAALAWWKGRKDKELANYKKEQIAMEKRLYEQEKAALEEKKRLSKEIDAERKKAADAWAKLNAKETEAKKMDRENRKAVRSGNVKGTALIVRAEQEVINDQVKATVDTGKEILNGLLNGRGVVEKVKTVAKAVDDHGDKLDVAKQKKRDNIKHEVDDTAELGRRLKRVIDQAIKTLNDPRASKEKQDKAWAILRKYNPKFHQVGGKYAVLKSYWTSEQFKAAVERIRKTKVIPKE